MESLANPKLVSSSLLTLLASSGAQGIVTFTDQISVSIDQNNGDFSTVWDIDQNSATDNSVTLVAKASKPSTSSFNATGQILPNGHAAWLVSSGTLLKNVANNRIVDAAGSFYNTDIQFVFSVNSGNTYAAASNSIPYNFANFPTGSTLGFRFSIEGETHYGIAKLYWSFGLSQASILIDGWSYNEVPNQGITGAATAVPEVETTAIGLAALALGAAGLRRWRQTSKVGS